LVWRFFILTILSAIAAVVTEIAWPEEAGLSETKASSVPYN
jgi:hypothetical protein